eukprot:6203748-Pleurochrysis_carterae.AAC.6
MTLVLKLVLPIPHREQWHEEQVGSVGDRSPAGIVDCGLLHHVSGVCARTHFVLQAQSDDTIDDAHSLKKDTHNGQHVSGKRSRTLCETQIL